MPNQPATPNRTLRIPDVEWAPAKRITRDRGETVTDVVRRSLRRYVRDFGDQDDVLALLRDRLRGIRAAGLLAERDDLDELLDELLAVIEDMEP